jgi:RHS repeat-associated protein
VHRTAGGSGHTAAAALTGGSGGTTGSTGASNLAQNYAALPLPFEPNLGQTNASVQYLSHGPGFGAYLIGDGSATFDLTRPGQNTAPGATITHDVLRLSLAGDAAASPRLLAQNQQAGYSNYFLGSDSTQWLSNVPQYGSIVEQSVYPGINLVWTSAPGSRALEYDFIVAPGANPSAIDLHIDGATSLSLDGQGNLDIGTGGGTLVQAAPVFTQPGSDGLKTTVSGSAVLLANGDVGFQVGSYNSSLPLTIDPVLEYSSYLGGSGDDKAYAIAADGSGDAYIAGTTTSNNFPTSTGSYQTSFSGSGINGFLTKVNAAGNAYVYSTYFGQGVSPTGVAVDAAGNAYLTGNTNSSTFPVTSGALQTAYPGSSIGNDGFVSKFNATGDALLYSTYLGISGTAPNAIAVDASGDAYLTGSTTQSSGGFTFPTTSGAFETAYGGSSEAFVSQLNASGTALVYSSYLGGSGGGAGNGIAVDASGEAFVTGQAHPGSGMGATPFPTTSAAFQTAFAGGNTAEPFVSKFNAAGSALLYSTLLDGTGSSSSDQANAIAVDSAGNAYVTGVTQSFLFPTSSGAAQTGAGGGNPAAFVSKVNTSGSGLAYSTYLGGSGNQTSYGIAVDPSGYAVVVGSTNSTNFPTTTAALQTSYGGGGDAFVTRVATDGKSWTYSSYLGGSGVDIARGVAADALGNAYLAGYTNSSNFPTKNAFQGSLSGASTYDAFVAKVSPLPAPPVFTSVTSGVSTSIGEITSSQNLTLSGTSDASATVTVSRSDLGVLGTTTSNGAGAWSYNYSGTTLAEGSYSFTTTVTNGGLVSTPSPAYVVIVDKTAPAVTLTASSSTSSYAPVVQVTATDLNGLPDGTSVTVQQQNGGSWTTIATGSLTGGTASITLPSFGAIGSYTLRAQVSDQAGNQGTSSTVNLTVNSATTWSLTAQELTVDPQAGDAQDQLGNVKRSLPLDLDQSGGGQSGGSALVYNSDGTNVEPIIQGTIQSPNNASLPSTVSAVLTWNGTAGATLTYSTSGLHQGDPLVIAAQVPSAVGSTGAYSWTLTVIISGQPNLTASGTAYVVTQDSSPFGAGWTFGPVDQITSVSGGVIMAYGTGEYRFYATAVGGSFTSPAGDNGTLSQSGGTYTYSTPDGRIGTFNSSGYETSWASADGQSLLTYTYNGSNQLATMTAIDGTTTFNYASGKVSTIVTGNSRTTTFAYSGSNLTQVTNPDGGVHTFSYDGNHHVTGETFANLNNEWSYANNVLATMTWGSGTSPSATGYSPAVVQGLSAAVRSAVAQQTDATGDVTQWLLDAQGRPLQQTAANGGVTTWSRNASAYLTATTDPLGRTTSYAVDAAGYTTQVTNPDGTTQSYAYQASYPTAFHALTSFTDERSETTTYAYDAQGHLTSTTDPAGDITTSTYLSSGLLQSVTDPHGNRTTYAYDTLRRLTATTAPNNGVTKVAYDANGFALTTTDPLGRVTTTLNDVMGRTTTSIDPAGDRTTITYNAAGLALTSTDPLGRQTSTIYDTYNRGLVTESIAAVGTAAQSDTVASYDADGRVSQSRNADGWVTTYAYDRAGNPIQSNDPLGGASPVVYDLARQQTASRNALGQQSNLAFDPRGRVTQSSDALGNLATTMYNAAGHTTSTTDALGHMVTTLYDAAGRVTTSIDALGDRTTTTYDAAGNVSTVTDPLGHVTSYAYDTLNRRTMTTVAVGTGAQGTSTVAYDTAGNVTSTTDVLGHVMTYAFDALNRQTAVTDALGHTVTTTYDAAGNVSTVKDALGDVTTYLYDAQNRQTAVTDPNGHKTTTVYDAAGRVVETIDAAGDVSQSDYNALGELVASVDALGKVTQYGYDAVGHRVNLTDPDGNTTKWVYDADGRPVNQIDALGDVTTTAYDAAGRATSTTDPLSHTATTLYDALGRVTTSIDALGDRTTTTYDAAGNVSTVTDPLAHVSSYAYDAQNRRTMTTMAVGTGAQATSTVAYDAAGNMTSATDALGHVMTYAYDAANRETAVTDPLSHPVTTAYDAANRPTTVTDALGDTTTTAYDAAGNPTSVQDPLGHVTTTAYDALNRATQTTDPLGHSTTTLYDAVGRVTTVIDALSKRTTTTYDAAGNETQLVDPAGNTTQWVYDALNRQVNTIDPFNNRTTTAYDAAGRTTSVTDQLGRVMTYAYDAANRLLGSTWKAAGGSTTNVQTFTYDAAGNQLTAADYNGTYTNSYDAQNRLTGQTDPFGVALTYAYDAASRQTTVQDSLNGTTTSVYDNANRLTTREFGGPSQTPLRIDPSYDNANRLTGLTRYSNLAGSTLVATTSYSYDAASRVTSIVSKDSTPATISYYNYQYDNADRVTVQSGTGATGTYTYDADNQVLSDGNTTYSYDSNGNRTMTGYQTGTDNQTTNDGTFTYTYDAVGNLTQKSKGTGLETWYYTYDNQNHLTVVRKTSNGTTNTLLVTYTYDVYGQRIQEDKWQTGGSTATTRFVWSNTQVIMDLNGSNVVQERYLWGDPQDQLFARIDGNGTAHWYLTDRQGSVRGVENAAGTSTEDLTDYTAFGVIISQTSASAQGRFCWTSKDFDPQTGEQYNWHRYYTPATGTWMSQDPLGLAPDTNPYRYVGNAAPNRIDPSGLYGLPTWQDVQNTTAGVGSAIMDWGTAAAQNLKNNLPALAQQANVVSKFVLPPWAQEGIALAAPVVLQYAMATINYMLQEAAQFIEAAQKMLEKVEAVIGTWPAASSGPAMQLAQLLGTGLEAGLALVQAAQETAPAVQAAALQATGGAANQSGQRTALQHGAVRGPNQQANQQPNQPGSIWQLFPSPQDRFGLGVLMGYAESIIPLGALAGQVSQKLTHNYYPRDMAGAAGYLLGGIAGMVTAVPIMMGGGGATIASGGATAASGGFLSPLLALAASVDVYGFLAVVQSYGVMVQGGGMLMMAMSDPNQGPIQPQAGAGANAPRTITRIGDLTRQEQATLAEIWNGNQPPEALPLEVRQQLANMYSGVANRNAPGFAQSAFNQARADYLLGRGPNPGPDVNAFAKQMGIPIFRGP